MKRNIIIGVLLIIVGFLVKYAFNFDGVGFLSGVAVGVGVGIIITSVFKKQKQD
ncbi:hypothetical protein ACWGOQ_0000085 [Aquimarina sp. M1]